MRSRSVGETDAPLSTTPINSFVPPAGTAEPKQQQSPNAERPLFVPIDALKGEGSRDGSLQDYRSSSFYKNVTLYKKILISKGCLY